MEKTKIILDEIIKSSSNNKKSHGSLGMKPSDENLTKEQREILKAIIRIVEGIEEEEQPKDMI